MNSYQKLKQKKEAEIAELQRHIGVLLNEHHPDHLTIKNSYRISADFEKAVWFGSPAIENKPDYYKGLRNAIALSDVVVNVKPVTWHE